MVCALTIIANVRCCKRHRSRGDIMGYSAIETISFTRPEPVRRQPYHRHNY